ncbi:unnamed protein product [Pedinophyceae sp. YPF-701]|nr:unnamed protein product [Pedinophyceae sp. YPF-701]
MLAEPMTAASRSGTTSMDLGGSMLPGTVDEPTQAGLVPECDLPDKKKAEGAAQPADTQHSSSAEARPPCIDAEGSSRGRASGRFAPPAPRDGDARPGTMPAGIEKLPDAKEEGGARGMASGDGGASNWHRAQSRGRSENGRVPNGFVATGAGGAAAGPSRPGELPARSRQAFTDEELRSVMIRWKSQARSNPAPAQRAARRPRSLSASLAAGPQPGETLARRLVEGIREASACGAELEPYVPVAQLKAVWQRNEAKKKKETARERKERLRKIKEAMRTYLTAAAGAKAAENAQALGIATVKSVGGTGTRRSLTLDASAALTRKSIDAGSDDVRRSFARRRRSSVEDPTRPAAPSNLSRSSVEGGRPFARMQSTQSRNSASVELARQPSAALTATATSTAAGMRPEAGSTFISAAPSMTGTNQSLWQLDSGFPGAGGGGPGGLARMRSDANTEIGMMEDFGISKRGKRKGGGRNWADLPGPGRSRETVARTLQQVAYQDRWAWGRLVEFGKAGKGKKKGARTSVDERSSVTELTTRKSIGGKLLSKATELLKGRDSTNSPPASAAGADSPPTSTRGNNSGRFDSPSHPPLAPVDSGPKATSPAAAAGPIGRPGAPAAGAVPSRTSRFSSHMEGPLGTRTSQSGLNSGRGGALRTGLPPPAPAGAMSNRRSWTGDVPRSPLSSGHGMKSPGSPSVDARVAAIKETAGGPKPRRLSLMLSRAFGSQEEGGSRTSRAQPAAVGAEAIAQARQFPPGLVEHPRLHVEPQLHIDMFKHMVPVEEGNIVTVYSAVFRLRRQLVLMRAYRVRQLTPKQVQRVGREIAFLERLHNHGICGYVGAFEDKGVVYVVTQGHSQTDVLRAAFLDCEQCGHMEEQQLARRVVFPLLRTLDWLHQRGIIHRAVRAENLLEKPNGTMRLTNFFHAIDTTTDRATSFTGALDYMPPEMLLSQINGALDGETVSPKESLNVSSAFSSGELETAGSKPVMRFKTKRTLLAEDKKEDAIHAELHATGSKQHLLANATASNVHDAGGRAPFFQRLFGCFGKDGTAPHAHNKSHNLAKQGTFRKGNILKSLHFGHKGRNSVYPGQPGRPGAAAQTTAVDIWQLGVLVFELLQGRTPFELDSMQHTMAAILMGDISKFPAGMSPEAKDFVRVCLSKDPRKRPTARQLIDHPFIKHVVYREKQHHHFGHRASADMGSGEGGAGEDAALHREVLEDTSFHDALALELWRKQQDAAPQRTSAVSDAEFLARRRRHAENRRSTSLARGSIKSGVFARSSTMKDKRRGVFA